MSVYHNDVPGLTPTMRRFLWKTHRMRVMHQTDDRMTVRIECRETGERHIARFQIKPDSGAMFQMRDLHGGRPRLSFLDIEPHLLKPSK